jgi:tetratricopeptide (TPR) repeat protein
MEPNTSFDSIVLNYNKIAMDFLHEGSLDKALKHLISAEKMLKDQKIRKNSSLWGITFNNLGCVYKKAENFKGALMYLKKALNTDIETGYDATNIASSHLNISAILSILGDHEKSLFHALSSLKVLKSSILKNRNYITSIVISYHSIGLESEHLRKFSDAIEAYKTGWSIAEKHLGPDNKLTESLKMYYTKACNASTMPVLSRTSKKNNRNRRTETREFLPRITDKSLNKNTFGTPGNKNFHRNPGDIQIRYSLYNPRPRKSLSPSYYKSKNDYKANLETINQLIGELDNKNTKQKLNSLNFYNKKFANHATVIQKHWRGFIARKKVKKMKKNLKVRLIPSLNRINFEKTKRKSLQSNILLRPIPEIKVESKIDGIILIQSWIRMLKQRKIYQTQRKAAIKIQKHIKSRYTRKLYKIIYQAIVFIQSVFRGFRVRKLFYKKFLKS